MSVKDLTSLSLAQAKAGLLSKAFSSEEITRACLAVIKDKEPVINAFVTVTEDEALASAKRADKKLHQGDASPLLGVPFSIKDNYCTQGIRTTASSKLLDDFIPPYSATVVERLQQAGIVLLGKTNMDAWAHGSSTETSDFGASKNPINPKHLPGGSSGGAAASVAANETIVAIGSETAGSIRQPAAWCGIVGLKPTYGRVSRYGVVAMGSSLDSPGPLTKTVADAAITLNVIAGKDEHDATTSPKPVEDYTRLLDKPIKGLKIGLAKEYMLASTDEVRSLVAQAAKTYESMGATVKEVSLFDPKYAIAVYTIIQRSEVSSNLARYDGIRFGFGRDTFGAEAKRRIMLGTYALSAGYYDQFYNKALKVRTVIIDDFNSAFKDFDVVIGPTSPTTALKVGASEESAMFGEMADMLVEPSSIAGLPGINVPVGFASDNLPVGMQIIGPQFSESLILQFASAYESITK